MAALTDLEQTLLFLLIVACLGACFIRAFWEIERARERRRHQREVRGRPQLRHN